VTTRLTIVPDSVLLCGPAGELGHDLKAVHLEQALASAGDETPARASIAVARADEVGVW
jgi:hypothetical protein